MVVLILCAGSQDRFNSVTPKQLMLLHKIPLLDRTITQVRNHNYIPYVITHNSQIAKRYNRDGVYLFYPNDNSKCVNTLLSTQELWNNRVVVLLGDVYYNEKCLDMTFNCLLLSC